MHYTKRSKKKSNKKERYNKKPATKYLKVGEVIKNYNELCKILKQPLSTGNSKLAQLKEFSRYFKYEKVGITFKILEIHKNTLPKVKRKSNNTELDNVLKDTILYYVYDRGHISLSKSRFYEMIGVINSNYIPFKKNKKELYKLLHISSFHINEFYNLTSLNMKNIVEKVLDDLSENKLITYEQTIKICFNDGYVRDAKIGEVDIIDIGKTIALAELGYSNMRDVIIDNELTRFNSIMKEYVHEKIDKDINYYFIAYDLQLHKSNKNNYKNIHEPYKLNELMIENFKYNANGRHLKDAHKQEDLYNFKPVSPIRGEDAYKRHEYRAKENYVPIYDILIHNLVNKQADILEISKM